MSGQMTHDQINGFLGTSVIARLATVKPDGSPYVVPVWQQWDGKFLYIVGRASSKFVGHIRSDPRVAISCADDVNPEHVRVLIEGRAEIIEGPAPMSGKTLQIADEMALRYMGPKGPIYVQKTVNRPRCLIQVDPESVVSWAEGNWHPRYTHTN